MTPEQKCVLLEKVAERMHNYDYSMPAPYKLLAESSKNYWRELAKAAIDIILPEVKRRGDLGVCDKAYRNGFRSGYSSGQQGDETKLRSVTESRSAKASFIEEIHNSQKVCDKGENSLKALGIAIEALKNAEKGFKHCSDTLTQQNYNIVRNALHQIQVVTEAQKDE